MFYKHKPYFNSNIIQLLLVLLLLHSFIACKKDDNPPAPTPDDKPGTPGKLLRSIEFDNNLTAIMHYNQDSTLKEIAYQRENIVGSTIFNWENKRLKEYYDDRSLYTNTVYYDQSRISHYTNTYKQVQLPSAFKMEYIYSNDGKLASLKRYSTNEAGTSLKSTSVYTYSTAGELTKVVTQDDNAVYTHQIESWSDSTYFNPLMFIDTGLFENYPVYNIPVLSAMKKFPAKIIRKVKIGNDAEFIDKIDENTCVIENKFISKITYKITIPGMPGYENNLVALFKY